MTFIVRTTNKNTIMATNTHNRIISQRNLEYQRNSENYKRVYVKIAYTETSKIFYVNKNSSISTFIATIKDKITASLNLEENIYDLVLYQPIMRAEETAAFIPRYPNNEVCYYFPTNAEVLFYIRLLNTDDITTPAPETVAFPETTSVPDEIFASLNECAICLNIPPQLSTHYVCGHTMCNTCYENCIRASIRGCPFCRSTDIV